jgi:nucleotide-binding universal stress UspA family protein
MTSTQPISPNPVGLPAMRRILVPVDFSDLSREALRFALFLAHRTGGHVHVLHVAHPAEGDAFSPLRFSPEAKVLGGDSDCVLTRMLNEFVDEVNTSGVFVDRMCKRRFTVADTVLRHARSLNCDVIVMGTHGRRALSRLLMGSVARDVLRYATVPVITIGADAARASWSLNTILFPIDLECHAEAALHEVLLLARMSEAELHLVHVLLPHHSIWIAQQYFEGPAWIAAMKDRAEYEIGILLEKAAVPGVDVRVTVLVGDENTVLQRHAKDFADLVVLGTPIAGHAGHFNRMAEDLVATAPCPVLSMPRMPRHAESSVVNPPQPRPVGV